MGNVGPSGGDPIMIGNVTFSRQLLSQIHQPGVNRKLRVQVCGLNIDQATRTITSTTAKCMPALAPCREWTAAVVVSVITAPVNALASRVTAVQRVTQLKSWFNGTEVQICV